MTPNFIVVVNVSLQICCHVGSGMPYVRIFGEHCLELLGAMTVQGFRNQIVVGIRN